jgi:hypothetical protein
MLDKAAWMAFRRTSDPADLTVGAGACATALKKSPGGLQAKKFGLSWFEVGAKKKVGSMDVLQSKIRTHMLETGHPEQIDRHQNRPAQLAYQFDAWWRLGLGTQADWPGENQSRGSAFWWVV